MSIDGFFFGFSSSSREGKIKFELVTKGLMCFFVERDLFTTLVTLSFSTKLLKFSSLENFKA